MEQPLYDILRGNWTLNRVIEDRQTDAPTSFSGMAVFEGDGSALGYRENGTLMLGGGQFEAERRYHWACHAKGASVSYDDGRPFHTFEIAEGRAEAAHLCGDDHYRGNYQFISSDEWRVTWTVLGPRKDYTSVTTYRRALSPLQ